MIAVVKYKDEIVLASTEEGIPVGQFSRGYAIEWILPTGEYVLDRYITVVERLNVPNMKEALKIYPELGI